MNLNKFGDSREEEKVNTSFTFRVPGTAKNIKKIEEQKKIETEVKRRSDIRKRNSESKLSEESKINIGAFLDDSKSLVLSKNSKTSSQRWARREQMIQSKTNPDVLKKPKRQEPRQVQPILKEVV